MLESEKRLHRCCFTGHRPEKLQTSEQVIKHELEKEIRQAIADGFTVFISGMARGVDLWAAQIVLKLREMGSPIKLICASPYAGFEKEWSTTWQQLYNNTIKKADLVCYISPKYGRNCFKARNIWMVNHSARVIAVYNGSIGGTKNTVDYAIKSGVVIRYTNQ